MKRPTLVLFDSHAILHRAFHAIPDFSTKSGEPTGALYGLATLILKTIEEFHPDEMVGCYDLPKPTFRDKLYKEYKGKRPKIDDSLVAQIARSHSIYEALGIPVMDAEGFEADDIIGTLAEKAKKTHDVLIVTGDMDTLQLVDGKKVRVYTLKKGIGDTIIYDEDTVKERYGFGPEHVADYKGFRGDPSDNIIGIPGVGEKTATTLITTFGGIEKIYTRLKKKDGEKEFRAAGLSPRIIELLRTHEEDARFSKMLATIRLDAPVTFSPDEKAYTSRVDPQKARTLFEALEFKSLIRKIPGTQDVPVTEEEKPQQEIPPLLWKKAQITLWVLDSDRTNPSQEDFDDVSGLTPEEKLLTLEREMTESGLLSVYRDIELPLIPIIERAQTLGILIDRPYLESLSKEYHKELNKAVKEIYAHAGEEFNLNSPKQLGVILFDKMGLTVKGLKKTEGGARSTRESELEKLRESHPIIEAVLRYREYQKLLSTYIDAIPELLDSNNRLHTTLHQTGAATGRMSSSDPNLQNIPNREGVGERIRDAFTVPSGKVLLSCDYSQIEMRVLAILSGDKELLRIFKEGSDVHTSVASKVFRVDPEMVTKDMRRRAKVINFGIVYGMGVTALQRSLGGTRQEAQTFYDEYLGAFPGAAKFMEDTIQSAKRLGYTTTLFGRRRMLRDIRSHLPFVRTMGERAAMNAPIQGTAADLMKIAMRRADEALEKKKLRDDASLLLQVHDELIFEVNEDPTMLKKVGTTIRESLEGVYADSPIPLSVTSKVGKRWGSMVDL